MQHANARTDAPPLSQLLRQLQKTGGEEITLGELTAQLSPKGYPIVMLLLAAPNVVPVPAPGLSAVVGLPLTLLMLRMALGYPAPWLPGFVARRKLSLAQLERVLPRAIALAERLEARVRPRFSFMLRAPFDRMTGLAATLLALIIMLPVPFGNAIPGLAICIIAIGMLRGDGLTILAGLLVAAGGVLFVLLLANVLVAAFASVAGLR